MYIRRIFPKYGLNDSKSFETPLDSCLKFDEEGVFGTPSKNIDVPYREMLGAVLYVSTGSRSDISYGVNLMARIAESPKPVSWNSLKRILKYLSNKLNESLVCIRQDEIIFECFSDADFGGCPDSRCTSGYILMLNETPIIWRSCRQTIVATSTCEAEFVSAATAAKDGTLVIT